MADINNSEDILDSRDIIARIEELEEELQDAHESDGDGLSFEDWLAEIGDDSEAALQDEANEFKTLKAFADELENYGDWEHGETLIRHSYFKEYAEEFASDIGAISRDAKWPLTHIDWDAAADALKADYTESDFDGVTYYMRA